ncbi:MAG TPA: hypothetical protein PLQ76_03935 [bacterium]|nr:hypothetical protein [bacterium]
MRKIGYLVVATCLGLMLWASSANAVDMSGLPPDLQDMIQRLLATRFPPELKGYTLEPADPVAGQPTKITVKISNDPSVTQDETGMVNIYYMVNSDMVWKTITLEGDGKTWTGEFPAFNSGDEIIFSIHAVDSSLNAFTTVPCTVIANEELFVKDYVDGDCTRSEEGLKACENALPRGCMMKMATDDDPLDDPDDQIIPDGDFVDYRIGYDDNAVYADLAVQNKISEGTMNPIDIHGYVGLVLNPDKIGKVKDLDSLLNSGGGAILLDAPLAAMAGGLIKPCFYGYMQGNTTIMDEKAVSCKARSNHLTFAIKKDALKKIGENKSGVYQFLWAGATITNFPTPIEGKPYDVSHVTSAWFTDQTYFKVQ